LFTTSLRKLRLPGRGRRTSKVIGLASTLVAVAAAVLVGPVPASAAVPGLVYVTAASEFDSTVYKSVQVFCPAGTQVVGGSYELVGAEGSVVLDDFIPFVGSLRVAAGEVVGPGERSDGTTESWQVRGTAVCANTPAGYTIVSSTSTFTSGKARAARVFCPAGTVAIGAGSSLANGFGQISLADMENFGTSVQAIAVDDEDGYSGSWSVTAYAICGVGLPGLHVVVGTSGTDSSFVKVATASCPAGQVVIGAGWSVFLAGTTVAEQLLNIHATVNGGTDPGVTGLASEDSDQYSGNWRFNAYATCANA